MLTVLDLAGPFERVIVIVVPFATVLPAAIDCEIELPSATLEYPPCTKFTLRPMLLQFVCIAPLDIPLKFGTFIPGPGESVIVIDVPLSTIVPAAIDCEIDKSFCIFEKPFAYVNLAVIPAKLHSFCI